MTIIVQVSSTATSKSFNSAFYDWVCPDVPMAPIPLVTNAIRDSAIELCERGLIWQQELQQVRVYGDVSTTTTATSATGDTSVTVDDITDFNDKDTITVDLTDGTKWRGLVSGTPSGSTINLDGALNEDVDSGAAVTKLSYLYPIVTPSQTVMAKILKAWLNDSPLDPISPDDLDTEWNNTEFAWVGANWRTDLNLPTRFYMENETTVGLVLAPDSDGNLRLKAALKPTRDATTLPTWMYERYVETIAHGAKMRIMLIPKKPYSDATMGAYHRDMFNAEVSAARIRTARGNTRAALRTHTMHGLR